jgi:hypothetical protein
MEITFRMKFQELGKPINSLLAIIEQANTGNDTWALKMILPFVG